MLTELRDIGFTEKEAKIYFLLLREGVLSAPKISALLNIDRRTVYDTLNALFIKGVISKKKVQNKLQFSAVDASIIAETIREKVTNFEKMAPQLKVKRRAIPDVNILYGLNAIKLLVSKALAAKGEVLLMGRGGHLLEQLGEAKYQYIPKLKKLNWKTIQTLGYKQEVFKAKEIRYLPKIIKLDTAFLVFSDHLYLFSKHEEILVLEIVDKCFANTFRQYFKLLWKLSSPPQNQ